MTQRGPTGRIRVALGLQKPSRFPALSEALAAAEDLDFIEVYDNAFVLPRRIIDAAPDIIVLYCPVFDRDTRNYIAAILPLCECKIIVITLSTVQPGSEMDLRRIQMLEFKWAGNALMTRSFVQRFVEIVRRHAVAEPAHYAAGNAAGHVSAHTAEVAAMQQLIFPHVKRPLDELIIAIGASTGGTEALSRMLRGVPPGLPGIVVVQHMPPVFTALFAARLDGELPYSVCEGEDGMAVAPGQIYIAEGSRHLRVRRRGRGFALCVEAGEKVSGHCPSVDVLFESVAAEAGKAAAGIIMTGMGADGAEGLLAMRRSGAMTIGQDEKSCVVYGMPKKAFEIGAVEKQMPPDEMPAQLVAWLRGID